MDKGFYDYSDSEVEAAGLTARKLGGRLPDLREANVTAADWDQLHKWRKDTIRAAKQVLEGIKETSTEDEVRKAEHAHDVTTALLDLLDGEMSMRKGNGRTSPVAHLRPVGEAVEVDGDGTVRQHGAPKPTEWRDSRGKPVRVYAPGERIEQRASNGFGVGDVVRAMFVGPRNDVEKRALSEGTDSAGGYTVPEVLAGYFIDKLRNETVCFKAGASTVPLTSDNLTIARITGDPTVAWTAENASIAASDMTFDAVTLVPKKLLCFVQVSRELLEDSININQALETAIVGAMSVELDRALLFGSGSSNEPRGLFNISGINSSSMGTNGATPTTYDDLIDAVYSIQAANGRDPTALIMNPRTNRTYAKLKDSMSNPLREPPMTAGIKRYLTNAVPITQTQGTATGVCSTVIAGDFTQMLVGMRRELQIIRSDWLNLQNDQVAFLARLRVDVAVTHAVDFSALIGIKP